MTNGQRTVTTLLAVVAVLLGSACGRARTPPVPGDIECLKTAYSKATREIRMKFTPRFIEPELSLEEKRKLNTRLKFAWPTEHYLRDNADEYYLAQTATARDSVTFLGGENANLPEPAFGDGGVKPMGRYRVESWYELDGNRRDFVAVIELAYAEIFVHGNSTWLFAPQLVSLQLGEEPQP